ncbi:MAG: PAS domain S-box protein, partial [Candidatus Fermentibacteria bacterium]
MTYSENAEDESIRELSNPEEQCGACPIDGLNAEECIDFFESMIAAITEPILVLNSDLKCVFANKNFSEMFGIEPSSIKNVSVFDIGNKLLDLKGLRDLLEELLSIHRDFDGYEVNLKLINIGERTMSLNATDVHQKNNADRLLLLSFFDITEQERAKKIQRLNEEKYKSIYETSRDAIMILEPPDWSFSAGNPATIRMFGCEDEVDFTSKQPWVLSPEYQPDGQVSGIKAKTMIERAIQNGSNYFAWTPKRLNGDEFPATVLLSRVELKGKTILQATVRDITGRKQVEDELSTHRFHLEEIVRERTAELEESEAKYRTLVEQSHDGIYIYGNDHFLFVNDRLCDLTSYTRDRLLNMKFSELLHTDERRMLNGDGTAKEGF